MTCYRDKLLEEFQQRHAEGWTDAQFARAHGLNRSTVKKWRRRLDLPSNLGSKRDCEYRRQRFKSLGLNPRRGAIGHQRSRLRRATELGWPGETESTARILNILYEQGPKTKVQLASMLGLKNSRAKMAMSARRGCGMRDLVSRGLVVPIGRIGHRTIFALAISVDRVSA